MSKKNITISIILAILIIAIGIGIGIRITKINSELAVVGGVKDVMVATQKVAATDK